MIKIVNLGKTYSGLNYKTDALVDVSFDISEGEFVAIMGKSGSGKSTLLNIIGCLDYPSSGQYFMDDVLVNDLSSYRFDKYRKEKVGFIFQNYELMEKYTVRENIELPLNVRHVKMRDKRKRVNDIMKRLGISSLAQKYPNQISGGEQQRVAIARAYVMDTKYILADEPTGALDEKNTVEIMNMFKEMNKDGKTIITVTHDLEVAGYADRILTLSDGKIAKDDYAKGY